jgi:ABC-type transport system involved in cytochrome c biogenesis permease component
LAGCLLTLWYSVAPATVRSARIGTGVLWTLAALASLTTLRGASDSRGRG